MKRSLIGLLLAAIASLPGAAFPDTARAAEKIWEMSFSSSYMDKHPTVIEVFLPWMETIKKETDGRVVINNFNPGSICPDNEILPSVISGVLSIGGSGQSMTAGKYQLQDVVSLPLMTSNAEAGSLMAWDGFQKFPEMQKEESQFKVLWHWASAPFVLHTTKKEVKTLEDMKGLKIIGWSTPVLDAIRALGASPIQVIPTDTYLSLQRGMADGVLCPLAPVRSFKINEATKYTTICNVLVTNFAMGMNLQLWNSLPPDIKAVFEKHSGIEMARACGKSLDNGAERDREIMAKQGHVFVDLPDSELERWRVAVRPIHEDWIARMEKKGLKDVRAIYDYHVQIGKKYAEEVAAEAK